MRNVNNSQKTVTSALEELGAQHAVAQQAKPNVVFMLMDNVGYGELGIPDGLTQ